MWPRGDLATSAWACVFMSMAMHHENLTPQPTSSPYTTRQTAQLFAIHSRVSQNYVNKRSLPLQIRQSLRSHTSYHLPHQSNLHPGPLSHLRLPSRRQPHPALQQSSLQDAAQNLAGPVARRNMSERLWIQAGGVLAAHHDLVLQDVESAVRVLGQGRD